MQDQLTGGQTTLQQPRSDLQQNTPNLQQSGTSTTTDNTAGVLSGAAPAGDLKVTTATSTTQLVPSSPVSSPNNGWLLLLLIIPVLLAAALLWPRKKPRSPQTYDPDKVVLKPLVGESNKPKNFAKTKKKSTKRKKQGRR